MNKFLKATGFQFINQNDRACAMKLLPYWEEIDAWRSTLSKSRQGALNNPREVLKAYNERHKGPNDTQHADRPQERHHRLFPSYLEQMEALQEQLLMAEERAERAEAEAAYFASMMDAVAKAGKLGEDAIAEIRARVRAQAG